MDKKELFEKLDIIYNRIRLTLDRKNSDYSGEVSNNAFKNFEAAEMIGVTTEQGMLVRILDKINRMSNLLKQNNKVNDESIIDTAEDLIGYALLLRVYMDKSSKSHRLFHPEEEGSFTDNYEKYPDHTCSYGPPQCR